MRIAFLLKYPYEYIGGVEYHVYNLAKELANLGQDVVIICTNHGTNSTETIEIHNNLKIFKYKPFIRRLTFFNIFTILDGGISFKPFKILASIRPDIIHVHKSTDAFLLIVALICRYRKIAKRVAYTPHYYSKKKSRCFMIFNYLLINKVDRVFAVTKNERKFLINEFKLINDKISICYNAVPKNYVDYVDRDDGYILYVGDFRKQQNKGLTNFLMALDVLMSEDATIKAKVVGKRTNDERFQELISSNNKSRVSFLGMQTQEQTDILFRECSFFVMPSYYETFGIVYIQAMSCGKAVIGVKSENIIEVIDDGVNGLLLDVNNQEQLVEAVKKLWNDKALRQLLGGNGREKVIRDFTWDKTAERLLADYESILAEKT